MEELKKPDKRPHRISLEDRKRLTVTSVEDIDSFNENEVIFLTGVGMMTVLGDDLHISRLNLDDGTLIIEGMIAALDYADHEEQRLNGKRVLSGAYLNEVYAKHSRSALYICGICLHRHTLRHTLFRIHTYKKTVRFRQGRNCDNGYTVLPFFRCACYICTLFGSQSEAQILLRVRTGGRIYTVYNGNIAIC